MGQPTWVLEGEASGSQALWSSSPLFPPALLQGKLLLPLIFFTVPYCRCMFLLRDSQMAQIPMHCRAYSMCARPVSQRHTHTHPQLILLTICIYLYGQLSKYMYIHAQVILLYLVWCSLLCYQVLIFQYLEVSTGEDSQIHQPTTLSINKERWQERCCSSWGVPPCHHMLISRYTHTHTHWCNT